MFAKLGKVRSHSFPTISAPFENSKIIQKILGGQIPRKPLLLLKAKGQDADDKDER
jgi:hypothetical protein